MMMALTCLLKFRIATALHQRTVPSNIGEISEQIRLSNSGKYFPESYLTLPLLSNRNPSRKRTNILS